MGREWGFPVLTPMSDGLSEVKDFERDVKSVWAQRAARFRLNPSDRISGVLDAAGKTGMKNRYLDALLKRSVRRGLDPRSEDRLLEIGCGGGRLVEYLARSAERVVGTDLVDEYIFACRNAPGKRWNAHYLLRSEIDELRELNPTKLYVVWVLMYVPTDEEIVRTLHDYLARCGGVTRCVVIEQVSDRRRVERVGGRWYCTYRTVEDYVRIFGLAGFGRVSVSRLGERRAGPCYRALRRLPSRIQRSLGVLGKLLYELDHAIVRSGRRSSDHSPGNGEVMDVMYVLRREPTT